MSTKLKTLLGAVIILVAGAATWRIVNGSSAADPRRQNVPLVNVERATRETVLYTLRFTGDVLPIQQAGIFSKVGGNLERIYADMGSFVHQNQLLALIDTTVLSQQFQEKAATFTNAQLNYDRAKELVGKNLISKQDFDNTEAAMKVAKSTYESAKIQLDYSRVTAPFSGYITRRFLDPGALVTSNNSTLFTLMDLDGMKIIINVLEKDIPSISMGRKAVITVDAFPQKQFTGTVTRYSQAVDLSTRTMAVEIDIPNKEHTLKPGMFANVILLIDEHKDALTIPTQALLKDDKGSYVYFVENGTARRKNLTLGIEQNGRTEVLAGLDKADTYITTGQQFVKDGGQVTVKQ